MMRDMIKSILLESAGLHETLARECTEDIAQAARMVIECIRADGRLLIFGNGGSAADAQHIAAEFVNRFGAERRALPAIALTANTSTITSIANDSSYDLVFSRQIEAFGGPSDLAWAISTSGNSENVLRGIEAANELGLATLGLSGGGGGRLADAARLCIVAPTDSTPRAQELHIAISHIICELVERDLLVEPGAG